MKAALGAPRSSTRLRAQISDASVPHHSENQAVNEKALLQVLAALDTTWRAGSAPHPTFDGKVEEAGEAVWRRKTVPSRAKLLHTWLSEAHDYLNDTRRPCSARYRRAWELVPSTVIGAEVNETTVSLAAATVKADIARLSVLIEKMGRLPPGPREKQSVEALVERYRLPRAVETTWLYFVEAVRLGAEFFPLQQWLHDASRPPVGKKLTSAELNAALDKVPTDMAVPFTAVVFDAMCPGCARLLVPTALLEAIKLWRELHQSKRARARAEEKVERKARTNSVWDAVANALPPSLTTRDAHYMQRQWRIQKGLVSLDRASFGVVLERHLLRTGVMDLNFEPVTATEAHWVAAVVEAVRSAMPARQVRAHSSRSKRLAPPALPPTLLNEVDALFPQESCRRTGPTPIPARVLAAWIIYKFNQNVGWKSLPDGSTLHRHFKEWERSGRLRRLLQRAVDLGLVDVMRVGRML